MRRNLSIGAAVVCLVLGVFFVLDDDAYDPLDYPSNSFSIIEVADGDPVGPLPFQLVGDEISICLDGARQQQWQTIYDQLDGEGRAVFEDGDRLVELKVGAVPERIVRLWEDGKLIGYGCAIE